MDSCNVADAEPINPDQLLSRFSELDAFLCAHQQLWRPTPFTRQHLAWEIEYPELAQWLRARTLEQAEVAHNQPHRLAAPQPFPALAQQAVALGQVSKLTSHTQPAIHAGAANAVPGRKWQQLEALSSCLQFGEQPSHWLDWCAGKGHLGRYLAHGNALLTCVERDAELVRSGQQLSDNLQIPARHLQLDVMQEQASQLLEASHTAVALHACGDLHVRLMQLASAAGCRQLAIAPCCYNRIQSMQYQPLSQPAQNSRLRLDRNDLRLLQCETVTAGQRIRRQRDQSMAWRLGFDLLQREVRGVDEYLPTPPLPPAWLKKPYADYCAELARLKLPGIAAPAQNWASLEARGWQRLAQVRNLELLRDLFRRPLEIWLLHDRALYLQEQGYRVRLGSFCEHRLTPRNLLLLAEYGGPSAAACG